MRKDRRTERTKPAIRSLADIGCRGADGPVADDDLRLVGTGALPPVGPAERAHGGRDHLRDRHGGGCGELPGLAVLMRGLRRWPGYAALNRSLTVRLQGARYR